MSTTADSTVYMKTMTQAYALNALHAAARDYYRTARDLASSASQERQHLSAGMRPLGIPHQLLAEASAHHAAYLSSLDLAQAVLLGEGLEYSAIDALVEIATDPSRDVYFLLEK